MHPLNKKVKFMKDSIDFGSMEIPKLFRKLLIPTVLGMVFSAVFVITDGIFVGQGIGSDALAAVNITAPLFLISTGIGLMFGVGASVVASIHLSQGKLKTARQCDAGCCGFFFVFGCAVGSGMFVCSTSSRVVGKFGTSVAFGGGIYVLVLAFSGI